MEIIKGDDMTDYKQNEYMMNWYKSQVKCCKEMARSAKLKGESQMAHYYTQEMLNYEKRIKETENELTLEN